jgi:hypothetical protein
MFARLTLVAVAGLLASAGMAQPAVAVRQVSTLTVLNQTIPDVKVEDTSLREVVEFLRNYTKANIEVRWKILQDAGIDPDAQNITLKLNNARLSQVLWEIMNQAGSGELRLAYRAVGNNIVVSTQKDLGGEMISKVYDVRDLLAGVARFEAPQMDPSQAMNQMSSGGGGGGGGGGGSGLFGGNRGQNQRSQIGAAGDEGPEMKKIIDMITLTIAPDTWEKAGGKGSIHTFNGLVVVYNSPLVHQQIAGFVEEEGLGQ